MNEDEVELVTGERRTVSAVFEETDLEMVPLLTADEDLGSRLVLTEDDRNPKFGNSFKLRPVGFAR